MIASAATSRSRGDACCRLSANSSPLRFIRQDVQSMHAYAIQHSVGMVKLDAMENPFTLPASLQAELGQRLGRVDDGSTVTDHDEEETARKMS